MPEMDGIEATASLRSREAGTGRHQPVIAMTALVMQGDRERCLAAGMDGYLTKPIRPRALDEVLDLYIAKKLENEAAGEKVEEVAESSDPETEEEAIDGRELLERVGNDREFLQELASLFREDGPKQLERIRIEIGQKDSGEVLRAAHSLRGTLANLGARSAAEMASEIEQAGRTADLARAEAALGNLELELPRVLDALSALCVEVVR